MVLDGHWTRSARARKPSLIWCFLRILSEWTISTRSWPPTVIGWSQTVTYVTPFHGSHPSHSFKQLFRTILSSFNPNDPIIQESPGIFCSLVVTVLCKMMPGKFHQIMSVSDWYWFFPTGTNLQRRIRGGRKNVHGAEKQRRASRPQSLHLGPVSGGKSAKSEIHHTFAASQDQHSQKTLNYVVGCEEAFIWDIQEI